MIRRLSIHKNRPFSLSSPSLSVLSGSALRLSGSALRPSGSALRGPAVALGITACLACGGAEGIDAMGEGWESSPELGAAHQALSFGRGVMGGSGSSSDRFRKADVTRDGDNYFFMANGWGPNFGSQTVSFNGTAFTVESMTGSQGGNFEPASYPTVFCGQYSDSRSRDCGLPRAVDDINAIDTGWSWEPNGNDGEYNAAYDIWMGTNGDISSFSGYLMVWLREPAGQQPAGQRILRGVSVDNVPGVWDVWTGQVLGHPIINWVRAEGDDTLELEFDAMNFVRDAQSRGLEVPGSHVLSVAVGFEIWNGPVQNLESRDFYVDVQ